VDQKRQEEIPRYDPDGLLDALRANLRLKNDAALARVLEVNRRSSARFVIAGCRWEARC
jgi:hypothetical protein